MSVKTFSALVSNGQLHFQESLVDLEGQQVVVTLVPASDQAPPGEPSEPCAPEWMMIEHDVVFQMPFHWESMQADPIDAGTIRPTVILPEDLPDE